MFWAKRYILQNQAQMVHFLISYVDTYQMWALLVLYTHPLCIDIDLIGVQKPLSKDQK